MVRRAPLPVPWATLLWFVACAPGPQGDADASVDGGSALEGGPHGRGQDGGDAAGGDASGGRGDAATDGDVHGRDGGVPDPRPPYVMLRMEGVAVGQAELFAIAPDGGHWRVHEILSSGGLFTVPRVERYLPGPDGGHVLLELLGTAADGLYVAAPTPDVTVPLEAAPGVPATTRPVAFLAPGLALVESTSGTQRQLQALSLEETSSVALSPGDTVLGEYALAPDGSEVAYLSTPDDPAAPTRLHSVNADGEDRRELSQGVGETSVTGFFWSDSSEWLGLFVDDGPQASLWVVDRDASEAPIHVVTPPEDGSIETDNARFVPGDARVIYVELREERELHSAQPGAGPPVVLSPHLTGEYSVSPAGSWVAFFERDPLGDVSAYVQHSDGTGRRIIRLADALAQGNASVWSPDGSHVIGFARNDSSAPWVHFLARGRTRSLALTGFASTHFVGLSPDGYLALVEGREPSADPGELYVFDLEDDGAPPRALGTVPGRQTQLSASAVGAGLHWSSDGAYLYFLDGRPGARVLVRIHVESGERTELAPAGAIRDFALLDDCCGR